MAIDPEPVSAGLTWTVGVAAERLGIAAATLRTWERRYGVGPSHRTAGGHRRYTESDLDRLELVRRLMLRGVAVQEAARHARGLEDPMLQTELAAGHADDVGLDADELVEELLAATVQLEGERLSQLFRVALARHGVVDGWTKVLGPTLTRIGQGWADGVIGIHEEHLASERLKSELRAFTRGRGHLDSSRATILLASAEDDQHSLPSMALEAAIAERGLACHALGPRFPAEALARMVERVRPDAVFLWASIRRAAGDPLASVVAAMRPSTLVLVGGPGWDGASLPDRVIRTMGIQEALTHVMSVVAEPTDR